MRAHARVPRAVCGAIAVLAVTVGCDANAVDTAGTTQGATSGGSDSAGATAGGDAKNAQDGTAKKAPADPHAGKPVPLLREGSEGKDVREAQARLRQLGLFKLDPTGYYGTITIGSVKELQKRQGLTQSGTMTPDTWGTLREQTKAPTAEELNPPPSPPPVTEPDPNAGKPVPLLREGSEGKDVREAQARLQQLRLFDRNPSGYYGTITIGSVKELQKRQGLTQSGTMTPDTWGTLRKQTKAPTTEQLNPQTSYPLTNPDKRCTTGRVLCISKESRTLAWMVDGKVKAAMDVRFGSQYTPTREGTFKVDFKSKNHHSTLYDTPMPYALFFSGGQAVHYSSDFAAAGYTGASHGCVNVREKEKISKVFSEVKAGDKVIVYN